uniref:Uncharacterized protein n=1 Tax=Panagrellus redivivus TaxID=6233 RepID=A0A7E4VX03_PANRE
MTPPIFAGTQCAKMADAETDQGPKMVDSADSTDPHAPIPLMRASQSSPTCLFDCPGHHHHHHHHDHNGQNGRGDSLDRTEQHFLFPDVSGDDSETSGTSGYRAAIPPHIPGSARGRSKPLRRQQKTAETCCLAPIGALPVTRIPENNNHADDTTSECQYCPDCEAKDASAIQPRPNYNKRGIPDGRNSANSGKYVGNSKSHFFYGCPTVPRIKTFDECTPMMSASMHGLSTVHRSQPYEDSWHWHPLTVSLPAVGHGHTSGEALSVYDALKSYLILDPET